MTDRPRIAILGAGPIGLEAALAAAEADLDFTVYEAAGEPAGHLADWGHVRMFTPWSLSVSPRQRRRLSAIGLEPPADGAFPTGGELRQRVLLPLAQAPEIAPRLRLGARVREVGRQGLLKHEEIATAARAGHPFRLLVEEGGEERIETAEVVLDCTGTWSSPNSLGDGGIPAPGEERLARATSGSAKLVRRIPDLARERQEWAGRTVLLVGAGHSAQTAARDFAALAPTAPGTRVLWALRAERPTFGAVAQDPLPERARLAADAAALAGGASPAVWAYRGVAVERLAEQDGKVKVTLRKVVGEPQEVVVDRVLSLTGAVGDHRLYRQLQVHECYATCGPMKLSAALFAAGGVGGDCLRQTTHGVEALKSPEPRFFLLGAKSYGRNTSFLLRVGWEQVAEVMGEFAPQPLAAVAVPA
jgi:thioredoxin reductase